MKRGIPSTSPTVLHTHTHLHTGLQSPLWSSSSLRVERSGGGEGVGMRVNLTSNNTVPCPSLRSQNWPMMLGRETLSVFKPAPLTLTLGHGLVHLRSKGGKPKVEKIAPIKSVGAPTNTLHMWVLPVASTQPLPPPL